MAYSQSQIDLANGTDIVEFLLSQGEDVIKSGREYRWKKHDSVCIKNNKWFQHSQNKGGYPVDFVMEFYGVPFGEAVETLLNMKGYSFMNYEIPYAEMSDEELEMMAPPEDEEKHYEIPETEEKKEIKNFELPPAAENNEKAVDYLINQRGIDEFTVRTFEAMKMIYEDADFHNVVFVGFDNSDGVPKYASRRSTTEKFRTDVSGSDKSYGFSIVQRGCRNLMVFESPIDMMSFLSLFYGTKPYPNCVSLGGVSENALNRMLNENPDISEVFLCLDNDKAGNNACERIAEKIGNDRCVTRVRPNRKDWNDVLIEHNLNPDYDISPQKIRMTEYEPVPVKYYSEIESREVEWLWYPYIPLGKYVLMYGESGVGKTTVTANIIAAVTRGTLLPGMTEPFGPANVIYQTAEDSNEDTIKPRLEDAGADLDRVCFIDEKDHQISLKDDDLKRVIRENDVRMIIFDPVQAYLGDHVDMNRANDIRPILHKIGEIAEETKCTFLLIGHMNKNNMASVAQRGLGSIDFIAAARSTLLVVQKKNNPDVRVICHVKSSLAPNGKSIEYSLGTEEGFSWIGQSDITAEEAMSGKVFEEEDDEVSETKQELAERKIIEYLSEVDEMESNELRAKILALGIGLKTYNNARAELKSRSRIKTFKTNEHWYVQLISV